MSDRIHFIAPDGTRDRLDVLARQNNVARSRQIVLLLEPHLARMRAELKSGAKLPRRK